MKRWGFWLIFIFSVLALLSHGILTVDTFKLRLGLGTQAPGCTWGSLFDCATVTQSPYGQLGGIPLSVWGLATNLWLAVVAFGGAWRGHLSPLMQGLFLGLIFLIAGATVVMSTISTLILKKLCLYCSLVYLLSLGQWIVSVWLLGGLRQLAQKMLTFPKSSGLILIFGLPLSAWVVNGLWKKYWQWDELGYYVEESWQTHLKEKVFEFSTVGLSWPSDPDQDTPFLQLVEFIDLFCPHCKSATPSLKQFSRHHKGVRLTIKLFPLDSQCNPLEGGAVGSPAPSVRCQWHYALWCAHKWQKTWVALDWIFAHQEEIWKRDFTDFWDLFLKEVQLPREPLEACLKDPQTHEAVVSMAQEGQKAQVAGTPTIFANGRRLPRGQWWSLLERAYKHYQPSSSQKSP